MKGKVKTESEKLSAAKEYAQWLIDMGFDDAPLILNDIDGIYILTFDIDGKVIRKNF